MPAADYPSTLSRRRLLALGAASPLAFGVGAIAEAHTESPARGKRPMNELAAFDFIAEFDPMWQRTRIYTMEVAQMMPADRYSYRPVEAARTFAEQAMHIASSIYGFSAAIRGEQLADTPSFDTEGATKEEMLEILDGSFDVLINLLISRTPDQLEERIRWQRRTQGEATHSKRGAALTAWHHAAHHRAQMIVYLRLNGIEPPGYID